MTDKERERRRMRYETLYKPAYDAWIKFYPFTLEDLDNEQWADVPNYEGLYQVSTFGRVKNLCGRWMKEKILKPVLNREVYSAVHLFRFGKSKKFLLHRLVAISFISNNDALPEIDHVNGDKFNCRVDNLRWTTSGGNKRYAIEQGLVPAGEKHGMSKLSNEQATEIRETYVPYDKNFGTRALAKRFGLHERTVRSIVHGRAYQGASGEIHPSAFKPRVADNIREAIRTKFRVSGISMRALAREFGISLSTVRYILNKK